MLYIWIPEANGAWYWSTGECWQAADNIEQLTQNLTHLHQQDAVVLFPSRDTQIVQHSISKAQYKKLGAEGVQYLLEEYVIIPVDQMQVLHHFSQPDQLTILGVSQHHVATFLNVISLLPFKIQALLPDYVISPWQVDKITVMNCAGRTLVRESEYVGRSIADLALYLDYQAADTTFFLKDLTCDQRQIIEAQYPAEQLDFTETTFNTLKKPKQHPFNLLPKSQSKSVRVPYAKACAYLLAAGLVVQFAYDAVRWVHYKNIADVTAQQSIQQYQSWFGTNNRISEQNIKSQFESHLRLSHTADVNALQLLSRIGPVLTQHQIVAQRIQYQEAQFNLDLKANSAESIKQLHEQLLKLGFKVELGTIQATTQGVIGQVKIR
jgi:general secretion pathway protein L